MDLLFDAWKKFQKYYPKWWFNRDIENRHHLEQTQLSEEKTKGIWAFTIFHTFTHFRGEKKQP